MSRLAVFALGVLCGCLPSVVLWMQPRPQPQPVDLAPLNRRIEQLAIHATLERDRTVEEFSRGMSWTNNQLAKVAMQQEALDAYVRAELAIEAQAASK